MITCHPLGRELASSPRGAYSASLSPVPYKDEHEIERLDGRRGVEDKGGVGRNWGR